MEDSRPSNKLVLVLAEAPATQRVERTPRLRTRRYNRNSGRRVRAQERIPGHLEDEGRVGLGTRQNTAVTILMLLTRHLSSSLITESGLVSPLSPAAYARRSCWFPGC